MKTKRNIFSEKQAPLSCLIRHLLVVWVSVAFCNLAMAKPTDHKMHIFYPSTHAASVRQQALKSDKGIGAITPVVFAKFRDFKKANKRAASDFVVVPNAYLQYYPDYEPVKSFTVNNNRSAPYLVLSLDKNLGLNALAEKSGGVVDEVGRRHVSAMLETLLGYKVSRRVKTVTKLKDLLPLLLLGNADYILVREDKYATLKKRYATPIHVVGKTAAAPYAVLCQRKNLKGGLAQEISMSKKTLASLGFSSLLDFQKKGRQ